MITIDDLSTLRKQVAELKGKGKVAFVPTMGNLHDGHLTLVREAHKVADYVVVSIFVNPLQFGANEDLDAYPRTLQRDQELLESVNTTLLFYPSVDLMYPRVDGQQTLVEVPGLSDVLCGASRPGHFRGVTTVVCKLFNMVMPDVALFGKKDFQQLMVLRQMVNDLNMPIEIIGVDIVRELDGLAMSSRNGYLTDDERALAPFLQQTLQQMKKKIDAGERDYQSICNWGVYQLDNNGFKTDYLEIRRADDLSSTDEQVNELVILAAAYLGKARLLDNLEVLI